MATIIKTPALSSVLDMLLYMVCVLLSYHRLLCPSHSSTRQVGCLKMLRSPREQRPEDRVPLCWEAAIPSRKGTSERASSPSTGQQVRAVEIKAAFRTELP